MLFGSKVNYLSKNKRALSKYSVGSQEPGLAFDFIDNVYQKDQNQTVNFDGAITHARSGNATMTDGYGPELVVNSGFDSDSDWTKGTGWSIANGVARSDGSQTGDSNLYQLSSELNIGKVYEITYRISDYSAGSFKVFVGSTASSSYRSANGIYTDYILSSGTAGIYLQANVNFVGAIDNVSVREMPVIKWAPHNLLLRSEELDAGAWSPATFSVTGNNAVAPDGSQTADTITATGTLGSVQQSTTLSASVSHTLVCYAKYVDNPWIRIARENSVTNAAWFNIQTGVVGTVINASDTASITDVGNGWYKLELVMAAPNTSSQINFVSLSGVDNSTSMTSGKSAYVWGFHLYRSDLGGMVDNPDQPPSRSSYVPTTTAAKYLPRIGHHVYTGSSAWANEGLLAESEARTNLIEHSNELNGSTWSAGGLASRTANEVGPDGVENSAYTLLANTSTGSHHNNNNTAVTAGNTYTGSIYVKKGTQRYVRIGAGSAGVWGARVIFDLDNGAIDTVDNGSGIIKEVGNGWYRCSVTGDASSTTSTGFLIQILDASKNISYTGAGTETVIVYGAQVEAASTPSSLIPTSGSSVTRASETFTIPSANLPWPEPNYIGSELVTNGTFDTDTSNWYANGGASQTVLSIDSQRLKVTTVSTTLNAYGSQELTLTAGKVYRITGNTTAGTYQHGVAVGLTAGATNVAWTGYKSVDQTVDMVFVATQAENHISLYTRTSSGGEYAFFDNISVREIDPLSVSIAMDGRVTYADDNSAFTSIPYRWGFGGDVTQAIIRASTDKFLIEQAENSNFDKVETDMKTADVFVPYQFASRHGSTFINAAFDGVALTANTAPTALPDLSSSNISLANIYMGTIGTFRVWDRDITDDGLVEATNPSLEPSLSLTFEGTGTNSFVVNDWSE